MTYPPFISDGWFLSPVFNNLAELREIKLQKHKAIWNDQQQQDSKVKTENESTKTGSDHKQSSEDTRQTQASGKHEESGRVQPEGGSNDSSVDNHHQCATKMTNRYRPFSPWFDVMPAWPLRYVEKALNELTPENIFNRHMESSNGEYTRSYQENNQYEMQSNSSSTSSEEGKIKYSYRKSTTTKSNGEKNITVTRSLGDRKHILTTQIDAEGNQQSTEDYINVDDHQIQQFEADLKAYSQNEFGRSITDNATDIQDNAAESHDAGKDSLNATKE